MNSSRISRIIFAMAGVALAAGLSVQPAAGEIVPHRAIYSLTLGQADSSGRYVDVGGAVTSVLEKTCDGWIIAEQVTMQIDTQVGGPLRQNLKYTGWESLDGRRYRFAARSRTNDERKSFQGDAWSDPDGPGEAVYTRPEKITMALPPGTHFYFGLTSWLIERAKAGVSRAETVVFDGTDEEGPQRAIVFIVPLVKKGDEAKPGLGPLVDRPGWIMRIAFYPLDSLDAAPDYEVQAVVLDNGVTPRLELVFTGFTAIQTLEKIEALELPNC